jgi:hypothetical protein
MLGLACCMRLLGRYDTENTYERTLCPEPATIPSGHQHQQEQNMGDAKFLTFSMGPQDGSCRLPLFKGIAVDKPFSSSTVMNTTSDIVVYGWIRRGQPVSDILLHLVTYRYLSTLTLPTMATAKTNVSSCLSHLSSLAS